MTTPRWQDDPEFGQYWGGYDDDLAFELAEDAVAADRRLLREQIQAMSPETVDATGQATIGASRWLPRDAVLDLLAGES